MKKFVFENIEITKRVRIPENRDLNNGIRLNRNERVKDFPPKILSRIFKNAKKYDLGKYPDQSVIYKHLSKFLKIKKNNLLLSSGIDGSIKSIFEIFLKKNDKIACLSPTYAMYNVYAKIFKVKLLSVSYNKDFKLNNRKLINVIKSGIKVLFIPNPNQPIEDNLNLKQLKLIASLCKKNKVLLVLDEAYHMFGSVTGLSLIKKYDNLIVLRTFSKSFGLPSLRLGYIISNDKIIQILNSFRLSYESNFLIDHVIIYFLKNFKIIKSYINQTIEGRNYISSKLKKMGIKITGGKSNFLLATFQNNQDYTRVYKELQKNKIYVKGNYKGILKDSILFTCGPKKIMKKVFKVIKKKL